MKVQSLLVLLIFVLPLALWSQDAEQYLKEADALFENMSDMQTAEKVLDLYRKALNLAENKYEPFWKISRIHYYIGEHTEKKKEKKNIFSQAIYYADKAIALSPEEPDGYYWRGVNNGKYGESRGVLKSLFLVKPIKSDMNKVLELDPEYAGGGAYRVLGRVFYELPGFAGGDNEKSLELLNKSLEIDPNDVSTRLFLGETLMALDKIEQARKEFEFILSLEDDSSWESDVMSSKRTARELLQDKKFNKD
ncbi:MAG: hypothetical protein GF421_02200 [Candidatus Aminicenantes bacterium]|nr:hypothetical protein [Candidatus Aminicenantes bacterium]